ncbi:hypothetical protein BH10ACI2_BH10ACI2_15560 [soil metagenome]
MKNINLKKFFLYLFIASVGISALIGIGVILFGDHGEFETMVLLTALTVTVTSILGLSCGAFWETGRGRTIPLAGIFLALISAVMWIYMIWNGTVHNDLFVQSLMSATLLSASCSHISLISLARLDRRFQWSRVAIYLAVGALSGYLIFLIWNPRWVDEQVSGRIIGVISIMIASFTVITPVFHKLSRGEAETELELINYEIEQLKLRLAELDAKRAEITGDI